MTRALRTALLRRFMVSAVAVVMAAAAVGGCGQAPAPPASTAAESSHPAVTRAAEPHLRDVEVFSHTYRLTPSGPLAHAQTVRLPLDRRVPAGWVIVVATAETSQGPWSYLPAELSANRRTAIFTTAHHSLFTVLGEDVGALLRFFKTQFLDGLSSGATASAAQPYCAGQGTARSGYVVQSSSGPAVYWCFGMAGPSRRILRIVNDRLYPMEIQHPGLAVAEKPAVDYGSLASLSHLISGSESILAPGDQIGYQVSLAAGQDAAAQTAIDGLGESLFALQTGINALLAILTRFGAGGASKGVTVMNDALGDAACVDAVGGANPGAILASCMSPKDMLDYFGTAGLLLAPLAAVGGLADFFASEFEGLHDVWTQEDQYTIVIHHLSGAVVPACSAPLLFGAAVAGQHFSTNPAEYPSSAGQGPGAYDPVCDGIWAIALVSHPQVGTTDGGVLFRAEGSSWTYVAGIGGVPADCILERNGVPASVAEVLWPPSGSQPSSYCGQ
jgi:hypothetical protein